MSDFGNLIILGDGGLGLARPGDKLTARPNAVVTTPPWVMLDGYQWIVDGVPVAFATSQVYTVQKADVGKTITVEYKFVRQDCKLYDVLNVDPITVIDA